MIIWRESFVELLTQIIIYNITPILKELRYPVLFTTLKLNGDVDVMQDIIQDLPTDLGDFTDDEDADLFITPVLNAEQIDRVRK